MGLYGQTSGCFGTVSVAYNGITHWPRRDRVALDTLTNVLPLISPPPTPIPTGSTYPNPNPQLGRRPPIDIYSAVVQGNILFPVVFGEPSLAFSSDRAAYTCTASDSPSGQNWSGSGYMAKYEIDTSIQIKGIFVDSLAGVPIDPTTVQLFLQTPMGTIFQFSPTTTPAVVRDATGYYHFTLISPGISGTWNYKWQGTGAAIATSPDTSFVVNPSSMIPG